MRRYIIRIPRHISMIKHGRLRCAGQVEISGDKFRVLVRKPEGKSLFERSRYKWDSSKIIFKGTNVQVRTWCIWLRTGPVATSCEQGTLTITYKLLPVHSPRWTVPVRHFQSHLHYFLILHMTPIFHFTLQYDPCNLSSAPSIKTSPYLLPYHPMQNNPQLVA
jgi:hypothetical protein